MSRNKTKATERDWTKITVELTETELNDICFYLNEQRNRAHINAQKNPIFYHQVVKINLLIKKLRNE